MNDGRCWYSIWTRSGTPVPVERAVLRAAYSALPAFVLSRTTLIADWLALYASTCLSMPGAHDQNLISVAGPPAAALGDSATEADGDSAGVVAAVEGAAVALGAGVVVELPQAPSARL